MQLADVFERPVPLKEAAAELLAIEAELARRASLQDPVIWAQQRLGDVLWSGQRRILESVRDHRKTAAATCHEIGKSYGAGLLAAWWIDTHAPGDAYVITTAPTAPQVRIILWKEIGRAHSRGNLAGRINQTEWMMRVTDPKTGLGREESVAIGRKPSDYTPAAFQGKHAPYVLVIVDEANGVRGGLWDSMDSLMANDTSKMLIIGNPDDPSGEFYEACKPNSGFNVVHVSAFDSPNFTGEEIPEQIAKQLIGKSYVEERRQKWAPSWTWTKDGKKCVMPASGKLEDTHPFWQSKVLGQFPVQTALGSLIPLSWIRAAQERTLPMVGPSELGIDVGASEGGDPSCLGHRIGPVFRVLYEERQPDTMKTTGRLIQHLSDVAVGAQLAKVDYIGVGRGVVDRCKEQNLPVYPISVGEMSTVYNCRICKHEWDQNLLPRKRQQTAAIQCIKCGSNQIWTVYANLLSQLWWQVRTMFEKGEVDLDMADEQLAEELLTISWEPNSKGQTVVKYSDELPSPNRADALLMAFAPVFVESKEEFLSW
jgi:DNA-directed RNA polymerase subunit RPC12/RpoP